MENWTDERYRLMAELHEKKVRIRDIRAALNELPGPVLTTGAVSGKYHRLYVCKKTPEQKRADLDRANALRRISRAKARKDNPSQPRRVVLRSWHGKPEEVSTPRFKARKVEVESKRKTILEVGKRECRWPDDKPNAEGLHTFCGCRTFDGSSYCEAHMQLSFGVGTVSERAAHKVDRRELA